MLQGLAIQDVWMIPRLRDRHPGREPLPGAGNWYGTTLRIYDPKLDAWRILWSDPATNFFTQQIGRAQGREIVQTGPDPRGGSMRWVFSEIEPPSFRWTAERAQDDRNWRREVEIRARRAAQAPGSLTRRAFGRRRRSPYFASNQNGIIECVFLGCVTAQTT